MYLNNIINQIKNNSSLEQVINPGIVQMQAIDSSKVINAIVGPLMTGGCNPGILPEKKTYPAAVYEPTSSSRWGDEEFEMFRTDSFMLTLYTQHLVDLMALVEQVKTALMSYEVPNEFCAIEIADVVIAYDDERDFRVAGIEVEITYLTQPSQHTPMGYVYYQSITAQQSQTLDTTRQQAHYNLAVTLVCKQSELEQQRASLKSALGGYHIDNWPMQCQGGNRITNLGQFVVWRESYQYSGFI